ncbi:unnamed protein product [Chilo suppressalis]|uniref:Cytochrome b5 domain-containing protein 1 n=1 Tax=Chilo suppressalis TaxID=168631 RepID=A0ABN8B9A9_CHISP|nr:unnamed protein product [Chilo suppressalis]
MFYTKQEWYTPAEVAVHNRADDCWVSLNGKVFDLTPWLEQQLKLCKCTKTCSCKVKTWFCEDTCTELCDCFKRGFGYCDAKRLAMTIVAYAGKDVSHWFKGEEWATYTHPVTMLETTYQLHGHGARQPVVPSTRWRPLKKPWWLNEDYVMGKATAKTRPLRIINTLTGSTVTLEVCSEETIYQIMMRYLPHNGHMQSYTWRYLGRALCLDKTLAQNGIPDERDRFSDVALPENLHIPAILIYFNDDLTEDTHKDDCFCHERSCVVHQSKMCKMRDWIDVDQS